MPSSFSYICSFFLYFNYSNFRAQVDHEDSASEEAFVWLATLVPLIGDVVNGRFTFETLTASSGHQLHFPAYDRFMKEIDK